MGALGPSAAIRHEFPKRNARTAGLRQRQVADSDSGFVVIASKTESKYGAIFSRIGIGAWNEFTDLARSVYPSS